MFGKHCDSSTVFQVVAHPVASFKEAYRAPDYFVFDVSIDTPIPHVDIDFSAMVTRGGSVYWGDGGGGSTPGSGVSLRGGWLNTANQPADCVVDSFAAGNGTTASAQAGGLSVGETYGWGGTASELGVGVGAGAGVNHTWLKKPPITLPGW